MTTYFTCTECGVVFKQLPDGSKTCTFPDTLAQIALGSESTFVCDDPRCHINKDLPNGSKTWQMKTTQPLPRLPDPSLPPTPPPRRVDDSTADPYWIAAMSALTCER